LKRSLSAVALLVLLALVFQAPSAGAASGRTVSVGGESTLTVPNDSAGLGFSVTKTRGKRSAALKAVAGKLRAVIAAVQGSPGVGDGDITTGQISVVEVTVGDRSAYRASEGIRVILHQPESAGELVTTAIAAGATGTRGPNFFVGNSAAAYDAALTAAFDQARERAVALAGRAGATLGPVISIAEDGEVTPVSLALPAADGTTKSKGSPPVKPGRSTVTATIHVVFELL
jgi:uncharacterized protein YggE